MFLAHKPVEGNFIARVLPYRLIKAICTTPFVVHTGGAGAGAKPQALLHDAPGCLPHRQSRNCTKGGAPARAGLRAVLPGASASSSRAATAIICGGGTRGGRVQPARLRAQGKAVVPVGEVVQPFVRPAWATYPAAVCLRGHCPAVLAALRRLKKCRERRNSSVFQAASISKTGGNLAVHKEKEERGQQQYHK